MLTTNQSWPWIRPCVSVKNTWDKCFRMYHHHLNLCHCPFHWVLHLFLLGHQNVLETTHKPKLQYNVWNTWRQCLQNTPTVPNGTGTLVVIYDVAKEERTQYNPQVVVVFIFVAVSFCRGCHKEQTHTKPSVLHARWHRLDSNPQPQDYKTQAATTTERSQPHQFEPKESQWNAVSFHYSFMFPGCFMQRGIVVKYIYFVPRFKIFFSGPIILPLFL